MSLISILIICLLSFFVSIFSVSAGGTSLLTVPMLISLGMISKNAVATNMFALIFLSIGGAIGFKKEIKIRRYKMISGFSIITIIGSFIGANLILAIDENVLKKLIALIICIIAGLLFLKKGIGVQDKKENMSTTRLVAGGLLIFILGIYGGFFSGGYVILLSYVLILLFGMNFLQAAFITKIFNVFSSLAACAFFYYNGLIDFVVGIPLAIAMSIGAFWGARLALAKGNLWVRNLFITAIIILAIKLLLF